MAVERRTTNTQVDNAVELRADGDESKSIVGIGAVYYDGTERTEYPLWAGAVERIMPGAFRDALDSKAPDDVRGLFNHDPNQVLGRTSSGTMALDSTDEGLAYEIEPADTNVYRDVSAHLERGDVSGSSFSFSLRNKDGEGGQRWFFDEERNIEVREVLAAKLFDVGPVTFPAYDATTAGTRDGFDVSEARSSYDAFKAAKPVEGGPDVDANDVEGDSSCDRAVSDAEQRQIDADRLKLAESEQD